MKARKLAEAQQHLDNAAKWYICGCCIMCSMKTSFFKRKPDLHGATIEYFEAGRIATDYCNMQPKLSMLLKILKTLLTIMKRAPN